MANGKGKVQVALEEGSESVVVCGGIRVEFNSNGGIDVYGNVPVTLHPATNDTAQPATHTVTKTAYNIGDILPDKWIVGPVSPTTGFVMAIEPVAGALDGYQTWHTGEAHAAELCDQGHNNARQATDSELSALYNEVVKADRNDSAQFNTSGSIPYGRYWSSTPSPTNSGGARIQYFDDGYQGWDYKVNGSARVRCVRDEPGLTLA